MATDRTANDFDWVSAQSACTAETMFERLRQGAERDVERRNSLDLHGSVRYELHDEGDQFEVARVAQSSLSTAKTLAFVTFTREGRRIHVVGDGIDVQFTAIVAVNDEGACRFFVGEAEYAEWHVRKLALEHLFFDDEPET
jgi:hypothetical protein